MAYVLVQHAWCQSATPPHPMEKLTMAEGLCNHTQNPGWEAYLQDARCRLPGLERERHGDDAQ
jgi:hypothetical protein